MEAGGEAPGAPVTASLTGTGRGGGGAGGGGELYDEPPPHTDSKP